MLNVEPLPDRNHAVVFKSFALGNDLGPSDFADTLGNRVCRVRLASGTNFIRHDRIVALSSRSDKSDLPVAEPHEPEELPPHLPRYTLPSRYCDSSRLADFAW